MINAVQILGIMVGLLFMFSAAQNTDTSKTAADIQTIALCDMLGEPRLNNGKVVRVRGIYSSEFEKSAISAPECSQASIWIDFVPSHRSCTTRRSKKLDGVKWGRSVDVVMVGRFESTGHYGHLDAYPYRLVVTCVENVQPLGHFRSLPSKKN